MLISGVPNHRTVTQASGSAGAWHVLSVRKLGNAVVITVAAPPDTAQPGDYKAGAVYLCRLVAVAE